MSDYDRGKYVRKGKFSSRENPSSSSTTIRSFFNSKSNISRTAENFPKLETKPQVTPKTSDTATNVKQPTILLKTREKENTEEAASPKKSASKENEVQHNIILASSSSNDATNTPKLKSMKKSVKFLDDGTLCTENLQEYVQENSDFLVIGVIGPQSSGKSTIMNLLAHNKVTEKLKKAIFTNLEEPKDTEQYGDNIKILTESLLNINPSEHETVHNEIFKIQTGEEIDHNSNCTNGIDIFISSNRVIFLDCQPFSSISILDDLVESEHKRTSLLSEFIPLENSGEIQGLQLTAFLISVCHILIVVQDWFFDSNNIRFLQTAEMLKPSNSNPEDEVIEHFPHLILLHNKANQEDFTPSRFKLMQEVYSLMFNKTKFNIKSNMGLGTGTLINYLNAESCGDPINLYLLPKVNPESRLIYHGHPPIEDLVKRLKANILGGAKNNLTHVQLTEKTWLVYCSKVWDTVKKSSFFVEYTKLMP